MSAPRKKVPCNKCHGTGKVTLPYHLFITMAAIRNLGPCTTMEICAYLHREYSEEVKQTTMINRLAALIDFELVKRTPLHAPERGYQYEVVTNG